MTGAELRAHTLRINDATYAAWNARDPDAVAAIFAEDAVLREAGSGVEDVHFPDASVLVAQLGLG